MLKYERIASVDMNEYNWCEYIMCVLHARA